MLSLVHACNAFHDAYTNDMSCSVLLLWRVRNLYDFLLNPFVVRNYINPFVAKLLTFRQI